jgi:4a-hydroxytetrahydrobiopterin dehydratase
MKKLSAAQIRAGLVKIPEWRLEGDVLTRTFGFPDFVAAVGFVRRVARLAEAAGHHPDIDIRWNRVILRLTTHDAGGLTDRDFNLATACDGAVSGRRLGL